MVDAIRYKAFISYSRRDRRWAAWLHRSLESYRPPRGAITARARLRPIFRDLTELSVGPDLGASIRDALDRSDSLILLCSPASLASRWVAAELEHFLKGHAVERIFCVIVGGPRNGVLAGVPPLLRAALPPTSEPLAIDLRPDGDGRRLARLKLAAALLEVDLDTLVRRDLRRRQRWMAAISVFALTFGTVFGVLALVAVDAQQLAERQTRESEDLVAFMLGDLRAKLEPVGRLDALDGVGRKVLSHYARIDAASLDDAALAKQAKALMLLGSIGIKRGDLPNAERAFARAATTSAVLSARAPGNGDLLFDRAQTVYWLAFVQWRLDNRHAAERGFRDYARLADGLIRIDPTRADWRPEPAYARSNLGVLLLEEDRAAEALSAFEQARAVFQAASRRAPTDANRLADLVDAENWIADAQGRLGNLWAAYRARATASALLRAHLGRDIGNRPLEATAFAADLALGRGALDLGKVDEANALIARSQHGLAALVAYDPANVQWREYATFGDLDATDLALAGANLAVARRAHMAAEAGISRLKVIGGKSYRWRPQLEGRWQRQRIELARRMGDAPATRAVAVILAQVKIPSKEPAEMATLAGFAQASLGRTDLATHILAPREATLPPAGRDELARILAGKGQAARACAIVKTLYASGYRRPGFVGFWHANMVRCGIL